MIYHLDIGQRVRFHPPNTPSAHEPEMYEVVNYCPFHEDPKKRVEIRLATAISSPPPPKGTTVLIPLCNQPGALYCGGMGSGKQ